MNDKELSEKIGAALRRAYSLGQTYWQQADSEYTSQHKKADVTAQKFCDLVDETCALVAPTATSTKPADDSHATIRAFDERMRDPLNKVLAERGGAAGAGEVKTWQERSAGPDHLGLYPDAFACMEAEIADLRAQLARLQAPAGETIDTPEFRELLRAYDLPLGESTEEARKNLVAHIDAQLARQRQGQGEPVLYVRQFDLDNLRANRPVLGYSECDDKEWKVPVYLAPAPQAQGEPVAYMMPSDIKRLAEGKGYTTAFSTEVSNDTGESSVPVYLGPAAADEVRDAARYRWLRHGDNDERVIQKGPIDPTYHWLPRNERLDTMIDDEIEKDRALKRTTAADNQKG